MLASAAATVSSGKYWLTACSAASPTLAAAEEKAFAPAITNGPMKGSNCGGFARDILKRSAASDEAPNEAASRAGAACSATSAAWWTVSKGSAEASWNAAKQEPGPVEGGVKNVFIAAQVGLGLLLPHAPPAHCCCCPLDGGAQTTATLGIS